MAHKPAKPQVYAYSLIAICVLGLWLSPQLLFAQTETTSLTTNSSRAERSYRSAEQAYLKRDFVQAENMLERAVKADDQFVEAWLLLGDVRSELGNNRHAREAFKKAIAINEDFFPAAWFIVARLAWQARQYNEAYDYASSFLAKNHPGADINERARDIRNRAAFAIEAIANPVEFNPINLGEAINTQADEYINTIRLDDSLLFLTRRFEPEGFGQHGRYKERFFVSSRTGNGWNEAAPLLLDWPYTDNLGAMSISADGKTMYFAGCGWPNGHGSCDLYVSELRNGKWGFPRNLGGHINSAGWESQPCISSDGRELYFVRRSRGGASDIWMSLKMDNGHWSKPIKLDNNVNTEGNEMAPFIHPDGQTLYFSSTGHLGLGGSDLFISRRDVTGRWQKPENLGYPVNTAEDEINIIINARGDVAYLSAQRDDGFGGYDIYAFVLEERHRPSPVSWLSARVFDAVTKSNLAAQYAVVDVANGDLIHEGATTLPDGHFLISLPAGKDYALHVRKQGYLFHAEHFKLKDETETLPYTLEIGLQRVKTGNTVVLKNVFFDTDSDVLRADSYSELEVLTAFMRENPFLTIELGGHTDSRGNELHNLDLSERRAKSVAKHLVGKGIEASRISTKGYGSKQPVADNQTPEGREQNRRTEMRIVGTTAAP